MNKVKIIAFIAILLMISTASASNMIMIPGPRGEPGVSGAGDIVYNNTYYWSEMNQTPNMTAGVDGAPGLPGLPGADGLDNMTAGPPGPAGAPGTTDMSWNASYYLRDTSLSLTGEHIKRDVDNDFLAIYGGDAIVGGTGIITMFGKNFGGDNAVEVIVGDAAGTGNIVLTGWKGGAAPRMNMYGYNITGIKTITAPSDAVNKSYVDARSGGNADMTWNASYYLRDNSRTLTSEKVKRDVDNDLLSLYGGNAIAGGTGGVLSLFGKDAVNPYSAEMNAGDGGIANIRVTGWAGGANPRMDMNSYNISSVMDPVGVQDAATKNYVDALTDMTWNASYFLRDGSRAITDYDVFRDVADEGLDIHGGTTAAGSGAAILLNGHGRAGIGGDINFYVPNTAGDSDWTVARFKGNNEAPYLDMMGGFQIKRLGDPTAAQDAATMNYVDDLVSKSISPAASLLSADGHIQSNRTAILSAELTNNTAAQMAAIRTADDHISTNSSSGVSYSTLRLADDHTLSNLTIADQHIATNYSAVLRKADDHILTNVSSGSGNGYTLAVTSLAIAAPGDDAILYFGGLAKIPGAVGLQKMYFPKTGTIKSVEIFGYGTTAGTAEKWDLSIVNATSTTNSTLIAKVTTSETTRRWSNYSFGKTVPATAGDYIEIRMQNPGWVTNPAAQVFSGSIYIE